MQRLNGMNFYDTTRIDLSKFDKPKGERLFRALQLVVLIAFGILMLVLVWKVA